MKCIFCRKVILKRQNQSKRVYNLRKFCSQKCQHDYRHKTLSREIECNNCGRVFSRKLSGIKEFNYCSLKCSHLGRTKRNTTIVECSFCGNHFLKKNNQLFTKRHFCSRRCLGEWQSKFIIGEVSYNWKDGISSLNVRIRSSKKNTEWGLAVFKRDKYTCQRCGDKKGGNLNAHHKKQLSKIIEDNGLETVYAAFRCSELWDINNGMTVCIKCHRLLHKKG